MSKNPKSKAGSSSNPKSLSQKSNVSSAGGGDAASLSAMTDPAGYSVMYSAAESQYYTGSVNQAGPSIAQNLEDQIVSKMSQNKIQPTQDKANLSGRRVFLMRNAERLDRIFPEWLDMSINEQGKFRPYDLNQPVSLPKRTGGYQCYRNDTPISELGNVTGMMIGRGMKMNRQEPYKIYVSPAFRCIQTCHSLQKTLEKQNVKMCVEPSFFEWMGWYENLPVWLTIDELLAFSYKVDSTYKPLLSADDVRQRRGETPVAFYQRCADAMKKILDKEIENGNMLFVVHSLTVDALCRFLQGKPAKDVPRHEMDQMGRQYPYCTVVGFEELTNKTWRLVPNALPPVTYLEFSNRPNTDFLTR
ncbi:phosphoglycerate mutase family protein [Trichuris suis]|uniref:Phosphoglycerate mutase family protein n=1 Tax=Trichuris suis TaxID=68888 RepID=A0A085LUX0_9BILA|nr:hypothetical protein M513_10396 [Trichuris suis]KHJ46054.1 phosphoglycerate mutase family protein [Trichuris suis]